MMNEETITYKGKEYTKEEAIELAKEIMAKIIEGVLSVYDTIKKIVINIAIILVNNPPVGFKRYLKSKQMEHFESISQGKSNNWRKVHGLALKRN